MRFPPWKHQEDALHYLLDAWAVEDGEPLRTGGRVLAMDYGTGKTYVTLAAVAAAGFRSVLVLCPKNVVEVWASEVPKHLLDPFVVIVPEGKTVAERAADLEQRLAHCDAQQLRYLVVLNYDAAWRRPLGPARKKEPGILLGRRWDLLVLDELQRIKSPKGRAAKLAHALADHIPYRLGATGNPRPNSILDFWSQMRAVDESVYGKSYYRFEQRYGAFGGPDGNWLMATQREDEAADKFWSRAFRVDKSVLDLPPARHLVRKVAFSAAERRTYDRLEQQARVAFKATDNPAFALAKVTRQQQWTSGFLPETVETSAVTNFAKRGLLAEVLDDIDKDEPLVVFVQYREDINRVGALLYAARGEGSAVLAGRISQLKAWQRGDFKNIVVQIQAGGVGIDLTRARYVIYYSTGYNYGDYDQSLSRSHRPGQTRPVTYIHLLVEDTIDEDIYEAFSVHEDAVQFIMQRFEERHDRKRSAA